MRLQEVFNIKPINIINEGGNLELPSGDAADTINLKVHDRSFIVSILSKLLVGINAAYTKMYKDHLWDSNLLKNKEFLSGSSLHFFNTNIPDEEFTKVKPKVGDIDTQVDKHKEANLEKFLKKAQGKQVGPAKFLGYKRGNEQFSTLWELKDLPLKIQIDLEFVGYEDGKPTPWAQFSHSSDWEDIKSGVKGVFHKYLIQSFASLTKQEFLLRKMVGRGKAKTLTDVLTIDNLISFAVASKEGGGLRQKYEPVIDPDTGAQEIKDGRLVYTARPTEGYDQSLASIFSKIFGKRLTPQLWTKMSKKFWSFKGLLEVMDLLLKDKEKKKVIDTFVDKLFAKGAQGLYKGDPNRDIDEKMIALKLMLEYLDMSPPPDLEQKITDYKDSYKIDEGLIEAEPPSYARKGIKHIYNPGSSTEMKDAEFLSLIDEIHANGDSLDGISINLKVDGAGVRFGKDEAGRPFMMTSRVTKPLYAENIGDFEKYGQSVGQTEEQLTRTRNYDRALDLIVNSDFIKKLPIDTIVQAEMLFNPMAEKTADGLKFVNISYDPKKLGKQMTLVPFSFRRFSTGESLPNANEIKDELLASSTPQIKFVNNQLKQSKVDVSKIIDPVVKMSSELKTALASRKKDNPLKAQAKEILVKARKALSEAIINNPNIAGKDQLGKNIEGLVVNMPSGMLVKVTSTAMQAAIAAKKAAPRTDSKRHKTAVVTAGSFAGHKGHEQLVNLVLQKAREVGGDPYVYISSKVGPDDPFPPQVKLETWRKLYPEHANMFHLIVSPDGVTSPSPVKKIEKELVLPADSPYNKIILMVGADRYEGFKKWMNTLEKRMKDPVALAKYGGTQDQVDYEVIRTGREAEEGGTGISFTQLRNILKNPNASEEDKLALWSKGFDVGKLGVPYIKKLMDVAKKGMEITEMRIDELLNELDFPRKKVATPSSKITHDPDVGNWTLQVSKLPMVMPAVTKGEAKFVAKLTHKRKANTYLYGIGDSQAEAKANVLSQINPAQQDTERTYSSITADLNAPFTKEYLKGDASLWFRFDKINNETVMIMANRDYVNTFGAEIKELGFTKASKGRTASKGDATPIWSFSVARSVMQKANLIPNMRYTLEYTTDDKDGNAIFVMNPDSLTQGPQDKYRMGVPGVTIAATAINEDWDDDWEDIDYGQSEYLHKLLSDLDAGDAEGFEYYYQNVLGEITEASVIRAIANHIDPEIPAVKDHLMKLLLNIMKNSGNAGVVAGLIEAIRWHVDWPELAVIEKSLKADVKEDKIKGADGKACWKGYRYAGTVKGKDKCIPVKKAK